MDRAGHPRWDGFVLEELADGRGGVLEVGSGAARRQGDDSLLEIVVPHE
jgi:hypothetical protein